MTTIRITTLALVVSMLGCAASKEEIRAARTSGYKTDFAIVYSRILNIVRSHYPRLVENASAGTIRTAWHPIRLQQSGQHQTDSLQTQDFNASSNPQSNTLTGSRLLRTQYFIRFDIYVIGGKPWRVRIDSYASEWEAGAVPSMLSGASVPPWLKGRTDALYVELHKKLAKVAVKLKTKVRTAGPKRRKVAPPKPLDLKKFGKIPAPAARRVYYIVASAKSRDFKKLRSGMADEFVWNLGATPSARSAIVTWQADARVLERLITVLEAGCHVTKKAASKQVVCPSASANTSKTGGYTASFAVIAGQWKMTSFASDD